VLEKTEQLKKRPMTMAMPAKTARASHAGYSNQLDAVMTDPPLIVKSLNFSTYGASFVHIDREGKPCAIVQLPQAFPRHA